MNRKGFTVIELLVVLAAIGLLLAIAAPRYVQHVDRARDVALKESLRRMREAIDQFHADQGRYPANLDELVTSRYLRAVPEDPVTQRRDSWVLVGSGVAAGVVAGGATGSPSGATSGASSGGSQGGTSGVVDVKSGAAGKADDGSDYRAW